MAKAGTLPKKKSPLERLVEKQERELGPPSMTLEELAEKNRVKDLFSQKVPKPRRNPVPLDQLPARSPFDRSKKSAFDFLVTRPKNKDTGTDQSLESAFPTSFGPSPTQSIGGPETQSIASIFNNTKRNFAGGTQGLGLRKANDPIGTRAPGESLFGKGSPGPLPPAGPTRGSARGRSQIFGKAKAGGIGLPKESRMQLLQQIADKRGFKKDLSDPKNAKIASRFQTGVLQGIGRTQNQRNSNLKNPDQPELKLQRLLQHEGSPQVKSMKRKGLFGGASQSASSPGKPQDNVVNRGDDKKFQQLMMKMDDMLTAIKDTGVVL